MSSWLPFPAEGDGETPEQKAFLQTLGRPTARGESYGEPMPAEAFTDMLWRQRERVAT
ncbi:MAG TPA: hypothetical protein VEB70_01130 [Noviherbaspirillum sp.]|nr:hypothetical protein [Noviherbaspirillum sp.]